MGEHQVFHPIPLGHPKRNLYGHRDATMILVGYRHGLRASELTDLRWEQVDFTNGSMHVRRVKQGSPSTHPIRGDELRALRRLQREQERKSRFVFTSERGSPFTTAGFARMLERAGVEAKLGFKPHPHMLRSAQLTTEFLRQCDVSRWARSTREQMQQRVVLFN
jgi:type 1 fimbriae regulatory protein FimB/type 1 fimbriae regulatory protein FimE